MFLIVVKICEYQGPPHGAPMESLQGATFENPFRRPCLFIVTDFKPFLEVPVQFLIAVKICEPQGATFEKSVPASLLIFCDKLDFLCQRSMYYILVMATGHFSQAVLFCMVVEAKVRSIQIADQTLHQQNMQQYLISLIKLTIFTGRVVGVSDLMPVISPFPCWCAVTYLA